MADENTKQVVGGVVLGNEGSDDDVISDEGKGRDRKTLAFLVAGVVFVCLIIAVVATIFVIVGRLESIEKTKASVAQVNELAGRVDTAEQDLALVKGQNAAQDGKIAGLDSRLGLVEKATTAVGQTASAAKKTAESAVARQNARVRAENQAYKRMFAYVKGANSSSPLAKLSDAEVERKLNNGKWDLEGQIQAEYDALIAAAAQTAQTTAAAANTAATTANERLETISSTANQALAAGETAISAVSEIAKESRPLRHSVSRATKRSISAQVAAYNGGANPGPAIKAGAPEE